jgi:predicted secreted Zn-dependent protease
MLTTLLAAAALAQAAPATSAPAPATAAVAPARPLAALPGVSINYLDVAGKNMKSIQKSLDLVSTDPATKAKRKLFTWNVGAQVTNSTVNQKCTVQKATATLTSTVNMPRLPELARASKQVQADWQKYVSALEADAAANLWFINDQLRGVERSMVGVDCAKSREVWNAAMNKINVDLAAFNAARTAPPATAAAPKS